MKKSAVYDKKLTKVKGRQKLAKNKTNIFVIIAFPVY